MTAAKTMVVDSKTRKVLALLCLRSGLQPNATNSSDMFFNSIQCYASYWITINTGIFWGKICQTAAKSIIVDRKNRRALAMLCLTSGLRPNAANSSVMYFHSIRCYASYLTYASCDKHGSSSCTNVFGPSQKPWLWTEKNKGTSSCRMFGVGTGAKCCKLKRCADRVCRMAICFNCQSTCRFQRQGD